MKATIPFLLLAIIAGQAGKPVVFECDLWPGERLSPERLEVACRVELRDAPSDVAKTLPGVTVGPGQAFSFEQTRYVTREAGAFVAVAATKIHGRVLGPIRYLSENSYYHGGSGYADIPVAAGTHVEYLQYPSGGQLFCTAAGRGARRRHVPSVCHRFPAPQGTNRGQMGGGDRRQVHRLAQSGRCMCEGRRSA